jgi:hypothetical protein
MTPLLTVLLLQRLATQPWHQQQSQLMQPGHEIPAQQQEQQQEQQPHQRQQRSQHPAGGGCGQPRQTTASLPWLLLLLRLSHRLRQHRLLMGTQPHLQHQPGAPPGQHWTAQVTARRLLLLLVAMLLWLPHLQMPLLPRPHPSVDPGAARRQQKQQQTCRPPAGAGAGARLLLLLLLMQAQQMSQVRPPGAGVAFRHQQQQQQEEEETTLLQRPGSVAGQGASQLILLAPLLLLMAPQLLQQWQRKRPGQHV